MARRPRSAEEVQKFKNKILAASLKVIVQEGYKSLTMRRLGTELSMTATNLYHYFTNKEEIYLSLVIQGYKDLYEKLKEVFETTKDPVERTKAIMKKYLEFGLEKSHYYNIMFTLQTPKYADYVGTPSQDLAAIEIDYSEKIIELAGDAISKMLGKTKRSKLKEADRNEKILQIWTVLHGMISLYHSRTINALTEKPTELFEKLIDDTIEKMLPREEQSV